MSSQKNPQRTTSVRLVAQAAAKHGSSWFVDFVASQLVGIGLTVLLLATGLGYKADDSRVDEAAIVAAKQAGSSEIGEGYVAFEKELDHLQHVVVGAFPESWREWTSHFSLVFALVVLGSGAVLALARAPSRAHVLRDLGWGIAFPGVVAALATAVLEWRAMKGIKATLSGDRSARTLWNEGREAAGEAFPALGLALAGGAVLLVLGWVLHRRWKKSHGAAFSPRHVVSHFFFVAGLVPWIHLVVVVLLGAATKGSSTGASLGPWVSGRPAYVSCVALFSFGSALFWAARREVKRLEREEEEGVKKAQRA